MNVEAPSNEASVSTADGVWLMRFANEFQNQVFHRLLEDEDVRVTLATCTPAQLAELTQNGIGLHLGLHNNNEICNLSAKGFEREPLVLPEAVYSEPALPIAHQLLDRFERFDGELSSAERYYVIENQLHYWWREIEEGRPRAIVFMDVPHMYYEWVIIALARNQEIPVLVLADIAQEAHVYLDGELRPLALPGGSPPSQVLRQKIASSRAHKVAPHDQVLSNRVEREKDFSRLLRAFFRFVVGFAFDGQKTYPNGYYIRGKRRMTFGPNSARNEKLRKLIFVFRAITAKIYYQLRSAALIGADSAEGFTYFPLPSAFEATLHPVCSPLELRAMILHAIARLPEEHLLVVREHPMQFRSRNHQRFGRQIGDYIWLRMQPRVRMVGHKTDHFWLIENAHRVACVSRSSTFLEALSLGKETLVFGRNFLKSTHRLTDTVKDWSDCDQGLAHPGSIFQGTATQAKSMAKKISRIVNENLPDRSNQRSGWLS